MKLILENIGLLEKAEVSLQPLSVIAGENDNGKSTVGKVFFCIVKAINRYKEDLKVSKESRVSELLREAYFSLRKMFDDPSGTIDISLFKLRRIFIEELSLQEMLVVIEEFVSTLREQEDISSDVIDFIEKLEAKVDKIVDQPEDLKRAIEEAFTKVFTAEFDSEILYSEATEGHIELWEGKTRLIDLRVDKNNSVSLQEEVEPIEIKDATFIETPLILNFHDVLLRSQTQLDAVKEKRFLSGLPYTTLHTKDLFNKLKQQGITDLLPAETASMSRRIKDIIGGNVGYSKQARNFVYTRNDREISIKNTASGIKVFGLLQLLVDNDFVNKSTLLILDEPENHLHPKWQLKFAEILVDMAASGVFVLVSAHSPYLIEAIERYSEQSSLHGQVGFYLAKDNMIEDKNRLSDIFETLSEPFEIFRNMDAEGLQDE